MLIPSGRVPLRDGPDRASPGRHVLPSVRRMNVLRTPDERFADLPDYPFGPHYVDVGAAGARLRMHYVDEGSGPTVLLLHGEPTWSYLYRHTVAALTAAGLRALVPDLIGFGRSDKPADVADYSYRAHVDWLSAFVTAVGLEDAVVVGQDWGGLLGLGWSRSDPASPRPRRLQPRLPDRGHADPTRRSGNGSTTRSRCASSPSAGCPRRLRDRGDDAVRAAYDAPYRTSRTRRVRASSRRWSRSGRTTRHPTSSARRAACSRSGIGRS